MSRPSQASAAQSFVRVAAAGFGAAVGGPLGAVVGGMLGATLGEFVHTYAEKFTEKAAEKLFEEIGDVIGGNLITSSSLQDVFYEALDASLNRLKKDRTIEGQESWFENWEAALRKKKASSLRLIPLDQLSPQSIDDVFISFMQDLDTLGFTVLQDHGLSLRTRALPSELRASLTDTLPAILQQNFKTLIVSDENNSAWKELQGLIGDLTRAEITRLARAVEKQYVVDLELDDFSCQGSGTNSFYFRFQVVGFVGRARELNVLSRFLEDRRPFLWCALTGPAGSGKSRLAFEFGKRNEVKWHAGFPIRNLDPEDFEDWIPDKPTFIIVDDARTRLPALQQLIATLHSNCTRRPFPYPVRILVLERDGTGSWAEQLLDTSRNGLLAKQDLYTTNDGIEPPGRDRSKPGEQNRFLELEPLDQSSLSSIIDQVFLSADKSSDLSSERRALLIARLQAMDPLGRPLFAAILSDLATTQEQGRAQASSVQATLQEYLKEQKRRLWGPNGINSEDEARLALATISGGIDLNRKDSPFLDEEAIARYSSMCGQAVGDILPPLEPDIVGEIFALNHFRLEQHARNAAAQAWRSNSAGISEFLSRAASDFPTHPMLAVLAEYPREGSASDRLWWMQAGSDLVSAWLAVGVERQADETLLAMRACCTELVPAAGNHKGDEYSFALQGWATLRAVLVRIRRHDDALALDDLVIAKVDSVGTALSEDFVAQVLTERALTLGLLERNQMALDTALQVIERYGEATSDRATACLATCLNYRGVSLSHMDRLQEALDSHQEVIGRLGSDSRPDVQVEVARALVKAAKALARLERSEEAIQPCDEVARLADSGAKIEQCTAEALSYKASLLWRLGRSMEAISAVDEVLRRFGATTDPAISERVSEALLVKAIVLGGQLNRTPEVVLICDEIVERFGNTRLSYAAASGTGVLSELIRRSEQKAEGSTILADALLRKGHTLLEMGKDAEAIEVLSDLLRSFSASSDPELEKRVGWAREKILWAFVKPGLAADNLAGYDEFILQNRDGAFQYIREDVARAVFEKAEDFSASGAPSDALETYAKLIARFAGVAEPAISELVAKAMFQTGYLLGESGHNEDALAAYENLLKLYDLSTIPGVRAQVATAFVYKGHLLGLADRWTDALEVNEEMLKRFAGDDTPGIRQDLATIMRNNGWLLHSLDRPYEALDCFNDVLAVYGDDPDPGFRENVAFAWLGKGLLLEEEGNAEEAVRIYSRIKELFGEDDDPDICRVVTDGL